MLLDADGRLAGLFTDSDLARLIERRSDASLHRPISEAMINAPTTVCKGAANDGAGDFERGKFSELPVVSMSQEDPSA